jgi:hypothetical protein
MMRRWLPYAAIAAFYAGVILIVQMWIYPIIARPMTLRDAATRKYSALHHRVVFENDQLRQAMLRDSLARVVPTTRGLFVSDLDSATGYVERVLRRELGHVRHATVGVIDVSTNYGRYPGVTEVTAGRATITGEREGVPFCVVVLPEYFVQGTRSTRILAQEVAWSGLAGQCHFYAEYGAPGPHIRTWLAAGGARHFARHSDPQPNQWQSYPGMRMAPNFAARMRRELPLRGQKCLSGQIDVCAQSVASLEMTEEEREQYYRLNTPRLVYSEGSMLALLEQEFGNERFRRFWTSSQPFQEAFEQSFGVRLGDWVHEWVEPLGHVRAGARLGAFSIALTLLLIGALMGGALLAAQNRRI